MRYQLLAADAGNVARILRHLGLLPTQVPVPRAGRASLLPWEADVELARSGVE